MGDFPPNSNVVTAKFSEELITICFATFGPPVNAIRSISGCVVNGIAQFFSSPVITETTPSGMPASLINLAKYNREHGAISDAFIIIVHPAASAGASLVAVKNICAFQGTIAATTPIGSHEVNTCISGLSIGSVEP